MDGGPRLDADGFAPAAGLRHPLLQSTLASKRPVQSAWRRRGVDLVRISTHHVLDCGDGVRLTGRLSAHPGKTRELVILIHGWEGHHDSSYLYSMAASLYAAGYSVFRLNLRDHAGTHALNREMFHSARMDEVLGAIRAVRALPGADGPFSVVGFSLGGNFSLRVALHGPARGLVPRVAVGVSPAVDPAATLRAIDDGPRVLRWYFLDKWRATLAAKRRAWPDYDFRAFDTLQSFVDVTRRFVADYTDYPSLDAYFETYTLTPALLHAAPAPVALISARDDSVIPERGFEGLSARGSVLACELTARGGHCGFIEDWRLRSWAERRVLQLLRELR